ncbi:hypothetical protein MBLNU459_g4066t2 [Dothideomycetes sp. NU459]
MANEEAVSLLTSLLNKTLRIYTTDTRIFVGQMKCTDKVSTEPRSLPLTHGFCFSGAQDRNIILSLTHEYRQPPRSAVDDAAAAMRDGSSGGSSSSSSSSSNVKVDMLKRFVGLVVVPGEYITKIEVED